MGLVCLVEQADSGTEHGLKEISVERLGAEIQRGAAFDRLWLQGMISHHQGAIEMADTELAKGIDPASRTMAAPIGT